MKTGLPEDDLSGDPGTSASQRPAPPRKSWVSAARAALFVRRERWGLTWAGRMLSLTAVLAVTIALGRGLCSFLAITSPVGAEYLVVEGWMPAYAYREAEAHFRKGRYKTVITAGVTRDDEDPDADPRDPSAAEKLIQFGVPAELVVTASSNEAYRDRTFHAAMAVKAWLREQSLRATSIDVVTLGPHARRSRLLFENALGDDVQVGVIAIEERQFDPKHWWRSSAGVRRVIDESIAYLYARILF